jgi:hypothetical protein
MRIVVLTAAVLISLPLAAAAFKEGPFPNVTGGFGEYSCRQCHFDNALNAAGGTLTISGVPKTYSPQRTYPISVMLARKGLLRGAGGLAGGDCREQSMDARMDGARECRRTGRVQRRGQRIERRRFAARRLHLRENDPRGSRQAQMNDGQPRGGRRILPMTRPSTSEASGTRRTSAVMTKAMP